MKKYIIILAVCLFSGLGYAQNIKEYSSYVNAMSEFSPNAEDEKIMMIYFFDGKNSKIEKTIKREILKSENLKQLGKEVVLLTIDISKAPKSKAYNSRALRAYNHENIFPSIKVYVPGHKKSLPLQTTFADQDISKFLSAIKSL